MLMAIIAMPAERLRWKGARTSSAPMAEPAKTASNKPAGAGVVQPPQSGQCREAAAQQRETDAGERSPCLDAENGTEGITRGRW